MPKHEAFVIPQGLQFDITNQGVVIEHSGDIVLKGSLGMNIHRLVSTDGNIHLEEKIQVREVIALNGTVSCGSELEAQTIQAKNVEVASTLHATKRLHVSKKLLVHGDVQSQRVQCLGDLEVSGSILCEELTLEGEGSISGNVKSNTLQSHGSLHINGALECADITCEGSLLHLGSCTTQGLSAKSASVTIKNGIEANHLLAQSLTVGGSVQVPTMQITDTFNVESAQIHADIVVCGQFHSKGDVSGKILVLEAPEQTGAHRIKGCLELSDFAELVPNIEEFLTSRGLSTENGMLQLNIRPSTSQDEESSESSSEEDTSEEVSESATTLHVDLNAISTQGSSESSPTMMFHDEPDASLDDVEEVSSPARVVIPMGESNSSTVAVESIEERHDVVPAPPIEESEPSQSFEEAEGTEAQTNESVALTELDALEDEDSIDEIELIDPEPVPETVASPETNIDQEKDTEVLDVESPDTAGEQTTAIEVNVEVEELDLPEVNPLHDAIRENIQALVNNYSADNYPQAIEQLLTFLDSDDFIALQDELRPIWGQLLKHHQQENTRIQPGALNAFSNLSKDLQKL